MKQIKCPSCGASLKGEVNSCEYCGASFHKNEKEKTVADVHNNEIDSIEDYKIAMKQAAQNIPQMKEAMGEFQKAAFGSMFKDPVGKIIKIIFFIVFAAIFITVFISILSIFIGF